jgi:hypothetical protein
MQNADKIFLFDDDPMASVQALHNTAHKEEAKIAAVLDQAAPRTTQLL